MRSHLQECKQETQLYQRKPTLAQAWRMPPYGQLPDEPTPDWLIEKIKAGEVIITPFGLGDRYEVFDKRALPGDYVVLTDQDKIEFMTEEVFLESFEPIQAA